MAEAPYVFFDFGPGASAAMKTLRSLAIKLGETHGELVEIATYLTQDELAQMVMARRERVSTALNLLRQRGIVQYSARGRLRVDMRALTE